MIPKTLGSVILLAVAVASPAAAQSITDGSLAGQVNDATGQPLSNVRVELTDQETGFSRVVRTRRDGLFRFGFLLPGRYQLLAEQLAYLPVEVRGIPIGPGSQVEVPVVLETAEPPVLERTIIEFQAGDLSREGPEVAWRLYDLELRRLPETRRDLAASFRATTVAGENFEMDGLPGRFSGMVVDGVPYTAARHPDLGGAELDALPFPLTAFESAMLLPGPADVEWGDLAGGRLVGTSRRGTSKLQTRAFGDWFGDVFTRSEYFAPQDVSHNSVRGGLLVSGPVVRDTAHFVFGVEAQRLQVPAAPSWVSTDIDGSLRTVAADSFGFDLTPNASSHLTTSDIVSAFGRFDWQASDKRRLTVRANAARLKSVSPALPIGRIPAAGAALDGRDVGVAASFTSSFSPAFALELRAGFESSTREYGAASTPSTVIVDGPAAFGSDFALPGDFRRTAFRLSETMHITVGKHWLKLGGGIAVASLDQTYAYGTAGEAVFGDVDLFGQTSGSFVQAVGRLPVAKFTTLQAGGFVQDRWRIGLGADVTLGLRVYVEPLPDNKVTRNTAWLAQTGIPNDSFEVTHVKLAPRFGVNWDVGNRHLWLVRAEVGIHHGTIDPGIFADIVTHSGGAEIRRGLGTLGRWPTPPDSSAAPVVGPALALFGPDFQAPRTGRASLGVTGSLGGGTVLHLSATYRHTDFLPRRHDLNLIGAPTGADQFGRPVYGLLQQSGAMLIAEPGSNRRFADFDAVSALDPDGFSDYGGITARLERRVGRFLTFTTGYTYSRTTDNWSSGSAGVGGFDLPLTPFPDSLGGNDWADGRSDFDVPHRFVFGAELDFGKVRLAGLYRYRSGIPFTPGFRDGVDANGDGSYRNDPAFVDDQIAGVTDLFTQWDCLRTQVGRFAERNACDGPPIQSVDLRLVLGPFRLGYPVELVVDAMNLLEADVAYLDRALYLVDPAGSLTTDPATGGINVPLVANPNFGQPIRRWGSGRLLRFGVRVNYD